MTDERPSGQEHPRELSWSLADLIDVGDLHPLIAGLVLELPWGSGDELDKTRTRRGGGRRPDWFEWRRDQWIRALCSALDLIFEVVPDDPEDGDAIQLTEAAAVRFEAERLGLPHPPQLDAASPRQITAGPSPEAKAAEMLTAEIDRLRADNLELLAAVDSDKAAIEGLTKRAATAEADANTARSNLKKAQSEWGAHHTTLLRQIEDLTRALNDAHTANGGTTPKRPTVPSQALAGAEIDAAPCKVDGCPNNGPRQGRWAKVCADHQRAAKFGAVLLVGGAEYVYKETEKNVGSLVRKPAPPKPSPLSSAECCQPGCTDEAAPGRIYCAAHERKVVKA